MRRIKFRRRGVEETTKLMETLGKNIYSRRAKKTIQRNISTLPSEIGTSENGNGRTTRPSIGQHSRPSEQRKR